jgi:hypothetical protein
MTVSPLKEFEDRLVKFAGGQSGIRNPFVIVPVKPECEVDTARYLEDMAEEGLDDDVTVQTIDLGDVLSQTPVFDLVVELSSSGNVDRQTVEDTMQDRLSEEMVEILVDRIDDTGSQSHVVLLLNLGSLYPFTRASELLDELDRRRVRSTVGIPFPGEIVGGNLNFFGEKSRNYYPAHQIGKEIEEEHLQT